jgi:hypothetical protein
VKVSLSVLLVVFGRAHDGEEQRLGRIVCEMGRRLRHSGSVCDKDTWVYEKIGK